MDNILPGEVLVAPANLVDEPEARDRHRMQQRLPVEIL